MYGILIKNKEAKGEWATTAVKIGASDFRVIMAFASELLAQLAAVYYFSYEARGGYNALVRDGLGEVVVIPTNEDIEPIRPTEQTKRDVMAAFADGATPDFLRARYGLTQSAFVSIVREKYKEERDKIKEQKANNKK